MVTKLIRILHKFFITKKKKGFNLIELLIVVAVIGILAVFIVGVLGDARNKAYTTRTLQEFRSFQQAMELYLNDNNTYPDDVSRGIPAGIEEYLGGGSWPEGPYPGSVYDWDNINNSNQFIQISLRFL